MLRLAAGRLPATIAGAVRPRRPTAEELGEVSLAPAPVARGGVTMHALLQNEWPALTMGVVEGRLRPPRVTMAIGAFVVDHESGPFLVDAGMCRDCHTRHLAEMPSLMRALVAGPPAPTGIADAVRTTGIDPAALQFALLTHVHWDHVSGLADLPGLRARIGAGDLALVAPDAPPNPAVVAATLDGVAFEPVHLDGPPVLSFPASHDVFGDGTVVACDLSGHTPGHQGILLTLHSGRRVLLAGDAVWNSEQIRTVRQRPALTRLADADPDQAYRTIVRLSKLPSDITVLPAHDGDLITATFADGPLS